MNRYLATLVIILPLLAAGQAVAEDITFCVKKNGAVRVPVKPGDQCRQRETPLVIASDESVFKYKVGDTGPAGGIIFFVDYHDQYPDFDYLEAAPEDLPGSYRWCGSFTSVTAASGWAANAVGRGRSNTEAIIAAGCNDNADAAKAARFYTGGGKSDWFLPSMGELMLMYTNLRQAGAGAFGYAFYWSSTEYDANLAWSQFFGDGFQGDLNYKNFGLSVRPVRAF